MKKKTTIQPPPSEPWKERGHRQHRSGAGAHKSAKDKGSRGDRKRKAIKEQE